MNDIVVKNRASRNVPEVLVNVLQQQILRHELLIPPLVVPRFDAHVYPPTVMQNRGRHQLRALVRAQVRVARAVAHAQLDDAARVDSAACVPASSVVDELRVQRH